MRHRLVLFVGAVFRIETLHFFRCSAVSVTVKVNGNEGDTRRCQVLALSEDSGFSFRFFRRQCFFGVVALSSMVFHSFRNFPSGVRWRFLESR